jgi:MarR family 2-MHQ and catechol resistance regulon transcriptional repressor
MSNQSDSNSPGYQLLLQLLRTADTVWNASRLFFERWDISPSQFNVLNLLHLCPEGLSQTELSRELIMNRSNVTGLVDRLEKRGLVTRNEVASDRRAYRVVLSAAGMALIKEILPHYYTRANQVTAALPPHQVEELAAALNQIALNTQNIASEMNR